jgi:hypothetical protein
MLPLRSGARRSPGLAPWASYVYEPMNSFENLAYGASPLLYPPHRGEEGIKAFPLDGERLDRGECLSHMPPFSFFVGERKVMIHFVDN